MQSGQHQPAVGFLGRDISDAPASPSYTSGGRSMKAASMRPISTTGYSTTDHLVEQRLVGAELRVSAARDSPPACGWCRAARGVQHDLAREQTGLVALEIRHDEALRPQKRWPLVVRGKDADDPASRARARRAPARRRGPRRCCAAGGPSFAVIGRAMDLGQGRRRGRSAGSRPAPRPSARRPRARHRTRRRRAPLSRCSQASRLAGPRALRKDWSTFSARQPAPGP